MTTKKRASKKAATKGAKKQAADEGAPKSGRKHARVNLGMLVQVNVDTIAAFKQDHCANISEGGMFLRTDELRPIGSSLFFQFTLKDGGALIEGMAKVVRVVEQPGPEPRGMGVEFESLLEPSLSIVKALVDERRGA